MSAFSTPQGTQSNVTTYVRIFPFANGFHVSRDHKKPFDKTGGYLYHRHLQITKSF